MRAVEAHHLTKLRRGTPVVDDVCFTARSGQVVGLLGPNGSGKTTIFRLMTGLVRGRGTTRFDGRRFADLRFPRQFVGVSLGDAPSNLTRSGRAHLTLIAAASGLPQTAVTRALERVEATAFADRPLRTLSVGMRQRVALASAVIGDPRIVLLDEPTNGLDPGAIDWFGGWIRDLADSGCCVVMTTHDVGEAEVYLDAAVVLNHGRVVADGTLATLRAQSELGRIAVVRSGQVALLRDALGTEAQSESLRRAVRGAVVQGDRMAIRLSADDQDDLVLDAIGRSAASRTIPLLQLCVEQPPIGRVLDRLRTQEAAR